MANVILSIVHIVLISVKPQKIPQYDVYDSFIDTDTVHVCAV